MDIQKNLLNSLKHASKNADIERLGTDIQRWEIVRAKQIEVLQENMYNDMIRDIREMLVIHFISGIIIFSAVLLVLGGAV